MLEKIIYFLKRIFKLNYVESLPAPSLAGINGNYEMKNNFNFAISEDNNFNLDKSEGQSGAQDEDFFDENLLSYVLDPNKNEEENQFQYEEDKVEEMNKKIDYYKKDPDKLYSLSLNEILEINFYYEKRIQKLENINN